MAGWGRTGKLFAHNYITQVPDIIRLSKGITGGVLPLGLPVATEDIYDAFLSNDKGKSLLHGHSYTANPLACAAACANLDLMENPQFFDDIDRVSFLHNEFFKRNKNNKALHAIRQCGTILALEIKTNGNGNYFADIRDKAYNFFLKNGLLIRPLGPVIYLNPPYCITDEELAYTYAVIEEFLESIEHHA